MRLAFAETIFGIGMLSIGYATGRLASLPSWAYSAEYVASAIIAIGFFFGFGFGILLGVAGGRSRLRVQLQFSRDGDDTGKR